jgi:hypothetical protein
MAPAGQVVMGCTWSATCHVEDLKLQNDNRINLIPVNVTGIMLKELSQMEHFEI